MFVFRAEQMVPRRLEEVFEFFSRAENLEELTPPWLHFRILKVEPPLMREGTKIDYRLRWRAMPIRWTTEILQWELHAASSMCSAKGRTRYGITSTGLRK